MRAVAPVFLAVGHNFLYFFGCVPQAGEAPWSAAGTLVDRNLVRKHKMRAMKKG